MRSGSKVGGGKGGSLCTSHGRCMTGSLAADLGTAGARRGPGWLACWLDGKSELDVSLTETGSWREDDGCCLDCCRNTCRDLSVVVKINI